MPRPRGMVSLERALSKLGITSRSEASAMIRAARVSVDGRIVTDPSFAVVPERIRVKIDGQAVASAEWLTILLNKPRGYVTTSRDPEGRPTVLDLVTNAPARVFPVGRLDLATTGLLLLTNDNRFADWVTDPANAVVRTYSVTVRGEVSGEAVRRIENGVRVGDDETLRAHSVKIRKRSRRETHLVVELSEGKNREVRRLLEAEGHEVTRLKRISLGGLSLGEVQPGKWRRVTRFELKKAFPGAPLK